MNRNIVFRADDAGSSAGANRAIVETVRNGVVRNVSVMAPGPALEEAVPMLRELPDINLGLHVTLNAEWDSPKWGPVSPQDKVPSLLDSSGSFTSTPAVLHERGFSVNEAMTEVEAQLSRLRSLGLRIDYLDEHMGVAWIGLTARLQELCDREGLVYAGDVSYLSNADTQNLGRLLTAIEAGPVTPQVVVAHPGSDEDTVMEGFVFGNLEPGKIRRERAQDRRVLTDPLLLSLVEQGTIRSLTYIEAIQVV